MSVSWPVETNTDAIGQHIRWKMPLGWTITVELEYDYLHVELHDDQGNHYDSFPVGEYGPNISDRIYAAWRYCHLLVSDDPSRVKQTEADDYANDEE